MGSFIPHTAGAGTALLVLCSMTMVVPVGFIREQYNNDGVGE